MRTVVRYLSSIVIFLPAPGAAQFMQSPSGPFRAGAYPAAIVAADFNNDGNPDLAVANKLDGTVTILLGDGKGGLSPSTKGPYTVGQYPAAIALAPFNKGTGLVVANSGDGSISVLLPDGSGGFQPAINRPVPCSGPDSIVTGNFDPGTTTDVAVACLGGGVVVLFGNGDGTFQISSQTSSPNQLVAGAPVSITAADFNDDGHTDLAVASEIYNNVFPGAVTVLMNNGSGQFAPTALSPLMAGQNPTYIASADFNADGNTDLAVADLNGNAVTLLQGNGLGGFTPFPGSPLAAGSKPIAIALGTFFNGLFPIIAIANSQSNNVTVYSQTTAGAFPPTTPGFYPVGTFPVALAIADFNSDGKPDLAAANYQDGSVTLLLNTSSSAPNMVSALSGAPSVSTNSLFSIFGTGLAAAVGTSAPGTALLNGTEVTLKDASGYVTPLMLTYVSPNQINGSIPNTVITGGATFSVSSASGAIQSGSVTVNQTAPGLFSASGNGKGVAAAQFYADSSSTPSLTWISCTALQCLAAPLDVKSGNAVLVLYGSGIRDAQPGGVTVTAGTSGLTPQYAGQAPGEPDIDQVNVPLPATLAGSGAVTVTVSAGGAVSNPVTIYIQ